MIDEPVDYGEMRRKIHDALVDIVDLGETESTILAGWNLIWEGVHEDNKRSLTYITSDATGENPLTPWAARGFMNHIGELFYIGTNDDDDEYEDDD
jgi:hypothetical protein